VICLDFEGSGPWGLEIWLEWLWAWVVLFLGSGLGVLGFERLFSLMFWIWRVLGSGVGRFEWFWAWVFGF
jgi:hypothetical protein